MIPGDGAGGTPAPRPGDGRATHTSPGIEPTAQTKGSELLCQVSLSITRFRTLPTFMKGIDYSYYYEQEDIVTGRDHP